MSLEHFQALEEKVNQLINRLIKLKDENRELMESNKKLENKVQEVQKEVDRLRDENRELSEKVEAKPESAVDEEELRTKVEDLLNKVDEVVSG
ncbi:hypothetical protein DRQ36_02560 [bacterium]|nr:MAG: hypothetical protein DRQ36_02560 [bacterium]